MGAGGSGGDERGRGGLVSYTYGSLLRYDEALMKYLLLAELGYEVAQSNAAFIMDRKETELFHVDELWKRALVYWTRWDHDNCLLRF